MTASPDGTIEKENKLNTEFKVVFEEAPQAEEDSSQQSKHLASQTLEENYKETVELVKKYIRVDVPNLQVESTDGKGVTQQDE